MATDGNVPATLEEALYKALEIAIEKNNTIVAKGLRDLLGHELKSEIAYLVQKKDYDEALLRAGRLLETHRTIPFPLLHYGDITALAGRPEEAKRIFEHGASLFPEEDAFRARISQVQRSSAEA
ncbi:hypothetical protein BCR43DRAFT_316300 [Syncephalastrum racemosum]|uniref:Tetratricopeptide repeat protein n=1 Tax=Syncephalastrum racemosum TaxID=13706 RepID=A0A1X2HB97_SYNRA|nr:hypothetical protein BCR43DRAFT_316300 [Syncephalastrum racemosum]